MSEFNATRSDEIRARIIVHAARDLHGSSSATSPSSPDGFDATGGVGHSAGHRGQWAAAAIALILIGGLAGSAVTTALIAQNQRAAIPHPSESVASSTDEPSDADTYVGQGWVIERDGQIQLCLGGQLQSRPPGCAGAAVVLQGWDWDQAPANDEAAGVRWTDDVTVTGSVEWGDTVETLPILTLTSPVQTGTVSTPSEKPSRPVPPSGLSDEELHRILEQGLGGTVGQYWAVVVEGVIEAYVAVDDGTLQRAVDEAYGPGVVHVIPQLQPN